MLDITSILIRIENILDKEHEVDERGVDNNLEKLKFLLELLKAQYTSNNLYPSYSNSICNCSKVFK